MCQTCLSETKSKDATIFIKSHIPTIWTLPIFYTCLLKVICCRQCSKLCPWRETGHSFSLLFLYTYRNAPYKAETLLPYATLSVFDPNLIHWANIFPSTHTWSVECVCVFANTWADLSCCHTAPIQTNKALVPASSATHISRSVIVERPVALLTEGVSIRKF